MLIPEVWKIWVLLKFCLINLIATSAPFKGVALTRHFICLYLSWTVWFLETPEHLIFEKKILPSFLGRILFNNWLFPVPSQNKIIVMFWFTTHIKPQTAILSATKANWISWMQIKSLKCILKILKMIALCYMILFQKESFYKKRQIDAGGFCFSEDKIYVCIIIRDSQQLFWIRKASDFFSFL